MSAALLAAGCGTQRDAASSSASTGKTSGAADNNAVAAALQREGQVAVLDYTYSSASVQAELMAAVLKAFGGDAKVTPMADIASSWGALCKANNLVSPEMWKILYEPQWKEYIQQKQCVADLEVADTKGEEGWYFPTYVMNGDPARDIRPTCPGLPDWKALNDCAKVFATPETGNQGQYMSGAKAWGPYYGDPSRIKNLGLDYKLVFAGSEAALQAEWQRAYERGKPFLALMWKPHYLTSKYDLTRVEFPKFTPDCWGEGKSYACNWAEVIIHKLTSAGFADAYPTAARILKNYDLDNAQIGDILELVVEQGMTPKDAVAEWMKANSKVWQAWGSGAA
jgi:glycine betaine/proline transport system substrate-binding protein